MDAGRPLFNPGCRSRNDWACSKEAVTMQGEEQRHQFFGHGGRASEGRLLEASLWPGRRRGKEGRGVGGMTEAGQPLGSQVHGPALSFFFPACFLPSICLPPCSLTLPHSHTLHLRCSILALTPPQSLSAPGSQGHVVRPHILSASGMGVITPPVPWRGSWV
jgi:hypothetical protein